MLQIGFDAKRLFNNFTGFGSYSRTLLKNLARYHPDNNYFLFTPKITETPETDIFSASDSFKTVSPKKYGKFLWRSVGMWLDIKRLNVDLFHGLSHDIPKSARYSSISKVVTICDVVYRHYPDSYSSDVIRHYDKNIANVCQIADRVIAISESTKRDLVTLFQIDPNRISVIYPSCDDRFRRMYDSGRKIAVRKKYELPEKYLLYVGSVTTRKNLLAAVQAIELLPKQDRLPLVVVGKASSYSDIVIQYIKKQQLEQWVYFTQIDSNDDLPLVYQGAEIFVYPSLFEGFGIPVLEALCSHVPVITSNISSLPEVAGPHSRLVEPDQPEAITSAILEILCNQDLRSKMIQMGYEHSLRFDGETVTGQLVALYSRCLNEKVI